MTLGEILRQRRLELGLSQSAVAGTQITRNMLSQLEHDQASPSLKTLAYLAEVLQIPIASLLGEKNADLQDALFIARTCFIQGDYPGCMQALLEKQPLPEEGILLLVRSTVETAKSYLQRGMVSEARTILQNIVHQEGGYLNESDRLAVFGALLECAVADGTDLEPAMHAYLSAERDILDGDTRNLLLASACLKKGQSQEASDYLQHVETETAQTMFLKGVLAFREGKAEVGALLLERAEQTETLPKYALSELYRMLEQFYSARGNYQLAYHYAVLRMELL